jgi:hypothetical protein
MRRRHLWRWHTAALRHLNTFLNCKFVEQETVGHTVKLYGSIIGIHNKNSIAVDLDASGPRIHGAGRNQRRWVGRETALRCGPARVVLRPSPPRMPGPQLITNSAPAEPIERSDADYDGRDSCVDPRTLKSIDQGMRRWRRFISTAGCAQNCKKRKARLRTATSRPRLGRPITLLHEPYSADWRWVHL